MTYMLQKNMKTNFIILFFLCFFLSCTQEQKEISLSQAEWQFGQLGQGEKYPATVPGTVHTDLLANGLISDPFFDTNEADLQWIEKETWYYETSFSISKNMLKNEHAELVFEGLDTYAEVYLNEQLILQADNMFRSWRVDVKYLLRTGKNRLKVIFKPAVLEAQKQMELLPYRLPGKEEAYTRKAAYHFGWDWGPRFVTAGIWKDIRLQFWNSARIADVQIIQQSLTYERAELIIRPDIQNTSGTDLAYEVSILYSDELLVQERHEIYADSGIATSHIAIDKPKRWWTHQLGTPHLYTVRISLFEAGKLIDQIEKQIGLRTIELVQEKDSIGQSFYFKLNGIPLYAKGANVIPQDNFLPRVTKEKYEQLIDNALDANMNMLRVWGGGIYENELFYQLCDQKGILVWQDFMFACTMYRGDAAFMDNVKTEVSEQVKRLRHHPSIALWCGNNEIIEGWHNWGWQKQLDYSADDSLQLINDYQALFEKLIPDIITELDPHRAYHPSSPANGWGRDISYKEGDVHYWGVWWGMEPFEHYRKKVGRFVSEYGFQGMPSMSSFQQFVPQDELFLNSPAVKAHQKHPTGFETIVEYMARDFPVPDDFEKYIYVSQLLQARGISMAIEAHRAAKPYNMGTLYWQLNDCWPVTSWSSTDYYGTPKALHYAVRKAYADLLIVVDKEQLKIVSDMPNAMESRLKVSLLDFAGNQIMQDEHYIRIEPFGSFIHKLQPITFVDSTTSVLQIQVFQKDSLLAEKLHFFVKPKNLQLKNPTIQVSRYGENEIEVNCTQHLAKNVYLTLDDVLFSDNFFDLVPGKPIRLKMKSTKSELINIDNLKIVSLHDIMNN